jgi:hypothetical protein
MFPPNEYALFFAARYIEDLVAGKATNPDPAQPSGRSRSAGKIFISSSKLTANRPSRIFSQL